MVILFVCRTIMRSPSGVESIFKIPKMIEVVCSVCKFLKNLNCQDINNLEIQTSFLVANQDTSMK